MGILVTGAILGFLSGIAVGLAFLVYALLRKPRLCPRCGTPAPRFRQPANRRQMVWGGWTCSRCGCEVDSHGREEPA